MDTLSELDSRSSILFLGSGFSRQAQNIRRENLPSAKGLREQFAALLGVAPDAYDLRILADAIDSDNQLDLYRTLRDTFTVSNVAENQKRILELPWRKIYTTNYDDSIELFYRQVRANVPSYSYNDKTPRKIEDGTVIHLHGMIREITEDNVLNQLILSEAAYIKQHFETSPWYYEFTRDLKICTACYFVGYSLSDYHISSILMQNPSLRAKTFFIVEEGYDRILAATMNKYGSVVPIGMDKFSVLCHSLPAPTPDYNPRTMRFFRYVDPVKDRRTLSPPTINEIFDLLTYGTLNYQLCMSTLPGAGYVVPRQALVEKAASFFDSARCLLVHSRIGNGKTTFLYILAHRLLDAGYQCFWCKSELEELQSYHPRLQADIQTLKRLNQPVIIFDSYDMGIELAKALSQEIPKAKFVITVRTGVHTARSHEIFSKLPERCERINLNRLLDDDINDFRALLSSIGISMEEQRRVLKRRNEFREVVLALFGNRKVRRGLTDALKPLLDDVEYRKVFIASHILKWIGQDVDDSLLHIVTGGDPYRQIMRFPDVSEDVFSFDDDSFSVRSSILSDYLIENHFTKDDVVSLLERLVVESVRRISTRRGRTVLGRLMRFEALYRAVHRDLDELTNLFERWRRNDLVSREPLFWLQYAILKARASDWRLAESFIGMAYSRASEIPGFETYQIDTYALRLLLMVEIDAVGASMVSRFDRIIEKLRQVRAMIGGENYRWHAVQVLSELEPFASGRAGSLSNSEQMALVYEMRLAIQKLRALPSEIREEVGADAVEGNIEQAIRVVRNTGPRPR